MKKRKPISIRLPSELLSALREFAKAKGLDMTAVIERGIEEQILAYLLDDNE